MEIVVLQGLALPFCQRLYDLSLGSGILDVKCDLSLISVQVVIQACGRFQKEGRGDPVQLKGRGKRVSELSFDGSDRFLRVIHGQKRTVSIGNDCVAHCVKPLFLLK